MSNAGPSESQVEPAVQPQDVTDDDENAPSVHQEPSYYDDKEEEQCGFVEVDEEAVSRRSSQATVMVPLLALGKPAEKKTVAGVLVILLRPCIMPLIPES